MTTDNLLHLSVALILVGFVLGPFENLRIALLPGLCVTQDYKSSADFFPYSPVVIWLHPPNIICLFHYCFFVGIRLKSDRFQGKEKEKCRLHIMLKRNIECGKSQSIGQRPRDDPRGGIHKGKVQDHQSRTSLKTTVLSCFPVSLDLMF